MLQSLLQIGLQQIQTKNLITTTPNPVTIPNQTIIILSQVITVLLATTILVLVALVIIRLAHLEVVAQVLQAEEKVVVINI
tara:strand:- start:193 stop:435 length:243 start_codon:yes stop_codon:yes gene_type:complete